MKIHFSSWNTLSEDVDMKSSLTSHAECNALISNPWSFLQCSSYPWPPQSDTGLPGQQCCGKGNICWTRIQICQMSMWKEAVFGVVAGGGVELSYNPQQCHMPGTAFTILCIHTYTQIDSHLSLFFSLFHLLSINLSRIWSKNWIVTWPHEFQQLSWWRTHLN